MKDLILINDENKNENQKHTIYSENIMLMLGAATCSPISQLDGIDFGKVLSTRGDKTFIHELTTGQ